MSRKKNSSQFYTQLMHNICTADKQVKLKSIQWLNAFLSKKTNMQNAVMQLNNG